MSHLGTKLSMCCSVVWPRFPHVPHVGSVIVEETEAVGVVARGGGGANVTRGVGFAAAEEKAATVGACVVVVESDLTAVLCR